MQKTVSDLFGIESTTNHTTPEATSDKPTPEEKAREKFPERIPEFEGYREAVNGAWLFHRLVKAYPENADLKAIKKEFIAAKQHFKQKCLTIDGDLRAYRLAFPRPESGVEVTAEDREWMGVTDEFNDEMFLPAGFAWPETLLADVAGVPENSESTPEPESESSSDLTDLEGVGPKLADALAAAGFETADDVRNADAESLLAVEGVGDKKLEVWGVDPFVYPEAKIEVESEPEAFTDEEIAAAVAMLRQMRD